MIVLTRVIDFSFRFQHIVLIMKLNVLTSYTTKAKSNNQQYGVFFLFVDVLLRCAAMLHAGILHWISPGLLGCLLITPWLWTFAAQINIDIGQLKW